MENTYNIPVNYDGKTIFATVVEVEHPVQEQFAISFSDGYSTDFFCAKNPASYEATLIDAQLGKTELAAAVGKAIAGLRQTE